MLGGNVEIVLPFMMMSRVDFILARLWFIISGCYYSLFKMDETTALLEGNQP